MNNLPVVRSPWRIAILVIGFTFLYAPMLMLVIYSFNSSKLVTVWAGWSTRWYSELFHDDAMMSAVGLSLTIAALAATMASVLGTIAALVMVRFGRFRGSNGFAFMITAPLVMPDVITGLALLLLFVAEAYTSSVLQHFEEALESAIALAFFIPLLIGTGGNSGTQITSTLVRSMALGEVRLRDMGRVIRKEVSTSFLIALTLGLAGCLRAWMMGIGMEITLIVSLTLVCITLWSAIVSSVIPMVLKRIGIDPAVVSAPFIATLIDGTGLIIYFKIAQYFLGLN